MLIGNLQLRQDVGDEKETFKECLHGAITSTARPQRTNLKHACHSVQKVAFLIYNGI